MFVVGKGGVGKTTTAGALALALADSGATVRLLSTDPAHSLGDLFEVALEPGHPLPSPCTGSLTLEALDATGLARRWMDLARAPLVELFDRGTYLDREDVEGFLDLTLPGVDEVAGVLRLAELADAGDERVVVDTAPTGHTLRLLDARAVVGAWTEAFDAVAEKAAAVIAALTRRPVRLAADELSEALRLRARRFEQAVLGDGCAVLVEREGSVVEAESRRLHEGLEARGLRVAARVRVGGTRAEDAPSPPLFSAPFTADLLGCEGLRRWGAPGEWRAPSSSEAAPSGAAASWLRSLPPLLLFVGKGGVGKSTCAAAAALALSETRETLLLGTDPAGSLGDVLNVPLTSGEARLGPLTVRQVRAEAEFAALVSRYRESVERAFRTLGLEGGTALDRRVVESLLGLAPPGMDEVFAVSALLEEAGGRPTVVDTAPTGHFLRLLATPRTALDWTHQLLRILRKYRAALGLDAFAERLLDFAKRLKELNLVLSDPARSAALVVTQPGPLVAAETARLLARLSQARVPVAAVVANRTPPGGALPDLRLPPSARTLHAPALEMPPVGAAALRSFLDRWALEGAT